MLAGSRVGAAASGTRAHGYQLAAVRVVLFGAALSPAWFAAAWAAGLVLGPAGEGRVNAAKRSAVSTGQLSVLLRVHTPPIDPVVFREPV